MSRRLTPLLVALLWISLTGAVQAQGQPPLQYVELPKALETEAPGKVEVREFFWYGCDHCYALEPVLERWLKRRPANVVFVRTPAAVGSWTVHAQAYYTFEALGILERAHAAFFDAIHKENRRLNDEASIAQFAAAYGIDQARFRSAFNSFGVRVKLEKARRLYQSAGLDSVPNLVVAGKYVTNPSIAGGAEPVFKVIDQLVAKSAPVPAKRSSQSTK